MTKHNTKTPTMISAIKHPNRFGSLPAVQWLESWAGWVLWLKAVFALPMDESELAIYRQMHWPGESANRCTARGLQPSLAIVAASPSYQP